MIRALIYSIMISVLSIILLIILPSSFVKNEAVSSPYLESIEELYKITDKGLHPSAPEWMELEILIQKNNNWFYERRKNNDFFKQKSLNDLISQRSESLFSILFFIWSATFYLFFRNENNYISLLYLSSPTCLTILGVFSIVSLYSIVFGVLTVFVLLKYIRK